MRTNYIAQVSKKLEQNWTFGGAGDNFTGNHKHTTVTYPHKKNRNASKLVQFEASFAHGMYIMVGRCYS